MSDSDPEPNNDSDNVDQDDEFLPSPAPKPKGPLGPRLMNHAERKFGRFAIPHLVRYLAILQALTFFLAMGVPDYIDKLLFDRDAILNGEVWRVLTCLVVPSTSSILFAIIIVLFFFMIGDGLESAWGAFRVNAYVFGSLFLMTVVILLFDPPINASLATQPSFIVFECLIMAFAVFYPNVQILLMFIIPIKIKWLGFFAAAMLVLGISRALFVSQAPHAWTNALVIIAGTTPFLLAFGSSFIRDQKLQAANAGRRQKFNAGKPGADEAFHRCAVCDATDASDPEKEFRVAADGEEYCVDHLPSTSTTGKL